MAKQPINKALIKQAVLAAEANRRQSTAHTKTRGHVSGGGRKPWRQKGTGRARAGSSRSPIWIGGGIVFGPTKERNFKQKLPKKMAQLALKELFAFQQGEGQLQIVDSLGLKEVKTKAAKALLASHNVLGKRVVVITENVEPELVLSMRNIPGVSVVENRNVSILDLAHAQAVIIETAAAKARGLMAEAPAKPKAATKAKEKRS